MNNIKSAKKTKKRLLFDNIAEQIKHKNALVITGMRQVGKTTLMRQIFESMPNEPKLWFDFENPFDQKIFEDIEYRNIYTRLEQMANIRNKRLYIFIDEIQNFPEITKVIKYLTDHYQVKFFVTGSSNFYLKNLFPESLSGRKFLYNLNPLNFKEYLYFQDKISREEAQEISLKKSLDKNNIFIYKKLELDYENYIQFGGFPEVILTYDVKTKEQILKNIFTSFFEKDLKILSDYKDIREVRDLILLLALRVGSTLDISKIASELGVNRVKIYNYLEFLQGTFLIYLLPKFSRSIDRTVASGKKVYFTDTGLLNMISKISEAQVLENAVLNQLLSYGNLSFYNKKNTAEIDAILNKEIALEIKTQGTEKDYKKLKNITNSLKIKKQYIISKTFVNKKNFIATLNL